jgi:hypothetical protein
MANWKPNIHVGLRCSGYAYEMQGRCGDGMGVYIKVFSHEHRRLCISCLDLTLVMPPVIVWMAQDSLAGCSYLNVILSNFPGPLSAS